MKILVTFYSKTGNTRRAGEDIVKELNADIDEIIDLSDRKGIIGWLRAGRDEMKGYQTEIKTKLDPSDYDMVIIGTPVWAWASTPAVRAYVTKFKDKLKKAAIFCTSGNTPAEKPKSVLENILGIKVKAYTGWTTEELKNKEKYMEKLNSFIKDIKKSCD